MQNFLLVSLALGALMLCAEAKPYDFPLYQDLIQGVIQRESQAEREKGSPNEDYEKELEDIADQLKENFGTALSFNVMKMPHFVSSDDDRDDGEYVDHHSGDEDNRDYDQY